MVAIEKKGGETPKSLRGGDGYVGVDEVTFRKFFLVFKSCGGNPALGKGYYNNVTLMKYIVNTMNNRANLMPKTGPKALF